MPSISVVIPAFNEEERIGNALASLLNQSRPIDQIIVVDNNSKDRTADIARSLGVTVINETTQGMIPARNAGFDCASGDIIGRIDADTIVDTDWAEIIEQHFSHEHIVGLAGQIKYSDSWLTRYINGGRIYSYLMKKCYGHPVLMGPSMAIRGSVWERVRKDTCLDDKLVHEDLDLSLHIKHHGTIHYDPSWVAQTSARRITGNPVSFFIEYPIRNFRTYQHHKRLELKQSSK